MSAIIIHNPDNVPGSVTTGYQLQNTVLFAAMTGLVNVTVDTVSRRIRQGSIFELNGHIVRVTSDTDIGGCIVGGRNYIYAIPADDGRVNFWLSGDPPTWSVNKGAWYRGETNERALVECCANENNEIGVAFVMRNDLDTVVPANEGGTPVGSWNVRTHTSVHLERGWHRYVVRSGMGRGNGKQNDGDTILSVLNVGSSTLTFRGGAAGGGGVANISNEITGVFFHQGGALIVHVGGNGFHGGNGTTGGNTTSGSGARTGGQSGQGGGSGGGEESYIISGANKFSTERVRPGNNAIIERVIFDGSDIINDTNRYPFGVGVVGVGGAGSASSAADNEPGTVGGLNDAGWGGFGNGGRAGSRDSRTSGTRGGGGIGGGGGAPGWIRDIGDPAAGFVQIWRL